MCLHDTPYQGVTPPHACCLPACLPACLFDSQTKEVELQELHASLAGDSAQLSQQLAAFEARREAAAQELQVWVRAAAARVINMHTPAESCCR
jgi:hypothetical protein